MSSSLRVPLRRRLAAAAGVLVGLSLWVSAPAHSQSPTTAATVQIRQFAFEPQTITIPAGSEIRWVNEDVAGHQITTGTVGAQGPKPDGRISSGLFFRGEAFSTTFSEPGEYPYYCGVHPFMLGKVVVR